MHLKRGETRLSQFSAEFAIDDLFDAVLESSKLRDVIAVQLFDARGKLRKASTIAPDDLEESMVVVAATAQTPGAVYRRWLVGNGFTVDGAADRRQ